MSDRIDQFVTRVHRRAVAWGVVDRIGRLLAVTAGVAVVLSLVGAWRNLPVALVMLATAMAAVAVGIAWGWLRRPSRLDAAMEFDRQLNLSDLLSSAILSPQDDFGSAVRSMANAACAKHSPSEVVLHRLGKRAWGGVGLAWAMVIVVSLLASQGSTTNADESSVAAMRSPRAADIAKQSVTPGRMAPGGNEATTENHSQLGESADPSLAGKPGTPTNRTSPANAGGQQSTQTGTANAEKPTPPELSGSTPTDPTGVLAAGSGSAGRSDLPAGASGHSVTAKPANRPAPPWSSDHWPADRAAALQAVERGQVPDAYRDLVRDYFRE